MTNQVGTDRYVALEPAGNGAVRLCGRLHRPGSALLLTIPKSSRRALAGLVNRTIWRSPPAGVPPSSD